MQNLTTAECIEAYARPFMTKFRNVVLISSNFSYDPTIAPTYVSIGDFTWICDEPTTGSCKSSDIRSDNWTFACILFTTCRIEYCMAEPTEEFCTIRLNLPGLGFVIGAGVIKSLCILYMIFRLRLDPSLQCIGDALGSFLDDPDPTTEGRCVAGSNSFRRKAFWRNPPTAIALPPKTRKFWWSVISWQTFVFCSICWMGFGGIYVGFFAALGNTSEPGFWQR
jgi:hypothetical protein